MKIWFFWVTFVWMTPNVYFLSQINFVDVIFYERTMRTLCMADWILVNYAPFKSIQLSNEFIKNLLTYSHLGNKKSDLRHGTFVVFCVWCVIKTFLVLTKYNIEILSIHIQQYSAITHRKRGHPLLGIIINVPIQILIMNNSPKNNILQYIITYNVLLFFSRNFHLICGIRIQFSGGIIEPTNVLIK